MPRAAVKDIEIAYETYGEGYPLVLSHGYAAAKEMWDGQIGPFMERYRVVVSDVRGHGESDAPHVDDAGYTIDMLVEDQRALMDHLDIERAFIGGLSLGGMIAMRFALAYPERTRALVLCDTSAGMDTVGQFASNRFLIEGLVRTQGVSAVMRMLYNQHAASTMGAVRGEGVPGGIGGFINGLNKMSVDGFLGVARAAGDAESVAERLAEIAAPTLIVTGDGDFFRGASEDMAQRMPEAKFVMIENAFHGTCLWQPEVFTETVLDFLREAEASTEP